MRLFQRPIGPIGAFVMFAVVAAACGSDTAPVIDAAAPSGESTTAEEAEAAPPDSDGSGEAEVDADAAAPVEADDHLFPDLDTVNIVDGSTVNLADQLAGGDTPVLLWFWAPH